MTESLSTLAGEQFDDLAAERLIASLRWPDGPACLRCGSGDIVVRSEVSPLMWRCRGCRGDFTATAGTAMHGSRIGAGRWVVAARSWDGRRPDLARALGVSSATAGRVSAALEATRQPPGENRLLALLGQPADPAEAKRSRLPDYLAAEGDPTADMTPAKRACLAVLRNRPRGAEANEIAAAARLSKRHTQRCMTSLSADGYAFQRKSRVPWGHGSIELSLWHLELTPKCATALAFLPRHRDDHDWTCPDVVPPEFWGLFWSGTRASALRLPDDAYFVASTLLEGPDRSAWEWALRCLPVEALRQCRSLRGWDKGMMARYIDSALAERAAHA